MRCVFISKQGDVLPLAQRVEDEGNAVEMFIGKDDSLIVDRHITDFGPELVVIDSFGFGSLAHRLKKSGFSVVGSSLITDELEDDVIYRNKVLAYCGIYTDGLDGINVTVDGWFNGKDFNNIFYTVDDVVFPGTKTDAIYKACLGRLTAVFKKADYRGPIFMHMVVGKTSMFCKSLHARFSPATMLILKEGLKGRVTDVLTTMAKGASRCFMTKPGWFTSVQISMNPNPLFNGNHFYDVDAKGLTDEITKHVWLYGFIKKGNDAYAYRGKGGRIAVVAARGETIREARRRVYRTINNIKIADILYLAHVGQKATPQHGMLKSWGYFNN